MFDFLKRLFGRHKENDPSTITPSCPFPQPYVIIDTETTGLDSESDQIIQLSAIRYSPDGQPDGTFSTYLNPGRPIPFRASQVNKITDWMVANAPTADQVKDRFIEFTSGLLIVGYNTVFDLKFLCHTFEDAFRNRNYIDVLSLARQYFHTPNYKLETVANSIGYRPKGRFHNALSDCNATAAVLAHISQQGIEIEPFIRYFYGGPTKEDLRHMRERDLWRDRSEFFYLRGERARKDGRYLDALKYYDQAKEACGIVYPFLFESYAMVYYKLRNFQSEIQILDEGIARLGEENCPSLVDRREKAIRRLEAARAAELVEKEKARKRAERAERKQARQDELKNKPKIQQNKPILKMDDAGNILEEFPSVSAAERTIGIDAKSIRNAANGKQKHAGGFCWRFKLTEADGEVLTEN